MICQSFDTTRHYCEEHNMVIEKRDVALYRWYRYDIPVIWHNTTLLWGTQYGYWEERSCAVSEVILSKRLRQQKQCCIEGMSPHERSQKRTHFNKWVKEEDDEILWWFRCGTWERKRPIPMEVVDEVAVAIADRAERASISATSARAMSRELGVPWSTVRKSLCCILHWYLCKI